MTETDPQPDAPIYDGDRRQDTRREGERIAVALADLTETVQALKAAKPTNGNGSKLSTLWAAAGIAVGMLAGNFVEGLTGKDTELALAIREMGSVVGQVRTDLAVVRAELIEAKAARATLTVAVETLRSRMDAK